MKKLYILTAALLVLLLTSMMLVEKNDNQPTNSLTNDEGQALFYKGMITIKVKVGIEDLGKQKGEISFNIPSLDFKADKFGVNLLEKRFKYNPKKLKKGMPDLSRIYRIEFPEEISVTKVAREFSQDPNIEYAEPISIKYYLDEPNDLLYSQCQHLPQIKADSAWDIHHGEDGSEVIIGINDVGVDWKHPDLTDNVWQNLGEDADADGHTLEYIGDEWVFDPGDENGIDDDENGFTDDLIGWNFYLNSNDPMPIPGAPNNGHGTHCAGIAAGRTNNHEGIASIGWNLTLMPILADADDNLGWNHYNALIYAAENGADIISNSWASPVSIQAEIEVIEYVTGLGSIIIGAAGNDNSECLYYPACYPGVLSIAAVNVDDTKTDYSTYGPSIDICTPGGSSMGYILSTVPGGGYAGGYGTSMACPLAAGLLGLIKSYFPDWTNDQLIAQMLGTADNIDSMNPQYQYKLGSGRINAFHALVDTGGTVSQELKLIIKNIDPQDENGNDIIEPGEEFTLNMKFQNYVHCVGENNVMINIESSDPEIIILDGSATIDIPPDGFFSLEDQIQIMVSEEASPHFAQFMVNIVANTPIVYFPDTIFELLVAPSGIFVFEGEENGQDYSGTFIKEFLDSLGYGYTYSNIYPVSLKGFDAVFLSHGNFGMDLDNGDFFTEEHSLICQEFLEDGGNLYIEMGGLFSGSLYFGYQNYLEMKELFGVSNHALVSTSNPIDFLNGVEGSPFEGMSFNGSNQLYNWYIDDLEPALGAIIPFYENDYGNVSIMYDGCATYGHKTFYFSYALAELIDESPPNRRDTLLNRIFKFLDLYDPVADFMADTTIAVQGDTIHFTDQSDNEPSSWEWLFEGGTPEMSNEQNPLVVYNAPGNYNVTLIVSNIYGSDSLTIEDYITVDPETGINNQNISQVKIYPNPVKDMLMISYSEDIESMEILSISGQVIISHECDDKLLGIETSSLPDGIYFIRIKVENEEVTRKIIKIK